MLDLLFYRMIYNDLRKMSERQLIKHWENFGKKEGRICCKNDFYNKYIGFKLKFYINDHPECINKSDTEIISHYLSNINNMDTSKPIILINHQNKLTGAPFYLYNLASYLKRIGIKFLMLDIAPDIILQKRFNNINEIEYYYNDFDKLIKIITNNVPKCIYVNSLNKFYKRLVGLQNKYKIIFHSHETFNNFPYKNIINSITNFYVVSNEIVNDYRNNSYKNIKAAEPFIDLTQIDQIVNLSNETVGLISNHERSLDFNRIIICMCGTFVYEKGNDIFLKSAQRFKKYEFLWIGGKIDNNNNLPSNFFHIPHTDNPYKYFKMCDCFYMTSRAEASPYVIKEVKFFNKPIIYSENDIKIIKKGMSIKYENIFNNTPDHELLYHLLK